MASIYRLSKEGDKKDKPTGAWRVEIRKRGHPRLTKDFPTKSKAKTWATDTEYKLDHNTYIDTAKAACTLFTEAADQYLEKSAILKRGYSNELDRVAEFKQQHFAKKFMSDITSEDIEAYRDSLKHLEANQTLQDRLIKEMRLAGICSMADGNAFLQQYMEKHNSKFAV